MEVGSNKLYIENSGSSTPLIGGDFANNRVGINRSRQALLPPRRMPFQVQGDALVIGKAVISATATIPRASLDVVGTDAIVVPVGTKAQRPSAPVVGMIRYNSRATSTKDTYRMPR